MTKSKLLLGVALLPFALASCGSQPADTVDAAANEMSGSTGGGGSSSNGTSPPPAGELDESGSTGGGGSSSNGTSPPPPGDATMEPAADNKVGG